MEEDFALVLVGYFIRGTVCNPWERVCIIGMTFLVPIFVERQVMICRNQKGFLFAVNNLNLSLLFMEHCLLLLVVLPWWYRGEHVFFKSSRKWGQHSLCLQQAGVQAYPQVQVQHPIQPAGKNLMDVEISQLLWWACYDDVGFMFNVITKSEKSVWN